MEQRRIEAVIVWAMGIFCPLTPKERVVLIADVIKPEYDEKRVVATIRAHATTHKFLELPDLDQELWEAHYDRNSQVQRSIRQAAAESNLRLQRDAAERAAADADLARAAEVIGGATPEEVEEAKARVAKRLPHLQRFVTKPLNENPMLKALVAAELAGIGAVA